MSSGDNVRDQFSALQKQQKDRLSQLQQSKISGNSTKKKDTNVSMSFEVDAGPFPLDELAETTTIRQSQDKSTDQLRELKDENGRLRKLLAEKDYEIGYLRRIQEEERQAFAGANTIGGDAIATKVVELSKKNRELSAELESERAKLKKLSIKCKELESMNDSQRVPTVVTDETRRNEEKELKELRDKVKDLQARHTEAKSQLDITKQELKKVQKALEKEVGETVNIQSILNGTSNWRGRQQQIIALQEKLNEIKVRTAMNSTLGQNDDWDGNSLAMKYDETMSISAAQQRQRDEIRRLERERKEQSEQQKNEIQILRQEQQTFKDKFEQSKTRNNVLTNELKTLREQLKTSLEKSKHDDELIEVLLKQQQQMKTTIEQQEKDLKMKTQIRDELEQTLKLDQMKQTNLIKQLQLVIDQKETKIRELEMHLDENRIEYEKDDSPSVPTIQPINITSRHSQSITLAPMQLTSLKQSTTTDPIVNRLEKNGFSRPSSATPTAKRDEKDLKCLNAALELERNRLLEMIKTLQKRVDQSQSYLLEQENQLIEQKRTNNRLEKEFEKVKTDLNNVKNRTVKGRGTIPTVTKSSSLPSDNIDELETRLALKTDENDALKNALKSMLDAKEEDLKLYNETIQSVKEIFLQGIQHYKTNSNSTS